VAAAAVAIVVVLGSGAGTAVHPPVASGGGSVGSAAQTPRLSLAAQVLGDASLAVAKGTATRPAADQWFHTKFVQVGALPGDNQSNENWNRFDGTEDAYFVNGHLYVHQDPNETAAGTPLERYDSNATPMNAYDALASLPTEPTALLAAIDKRVAVVGPQIGSITGMFQPLGPNKAPLPRTRAELEFDYLSQLLWNAAPGQPPAAEAAVYRAMATIPAVTGEKGITDAAGRPAIGLSANGGVTELLLNPQTYQVVGMRAISPGPGSANGVKGSMPPKGTVVISMAWAQVTAVSGPGRR